jgi:F0F1-type ATP synthase assembly protein I
VFEIRFIEGDYPWPRAFSLWFSKPYRLCISPYILAEPAQVVADGLAASLDQHSDAASRESRKASQRGPRRHLALRIVSIAVCLFIVATSLYWIPQKLAASDWVGLLVYVFVGLVAGGLAIGFWRGGDAFYEAIFPDK